MGDYNVVEPLRLEPRDIAKAGDMLMWATLRPDGRQLAAVGRGSNVTLHDLSLEPPRPDSWWATNRPSSAPSAAPTAASSPP